MMTNQLHLYFTMKGNNLIIIQYFKMPVSRMEINTSSNFRVSSQKNNLE